MDDQRDKVILKITLVNCDLESAYKVSAYNSFDHFIDNSLIGETQEENPNNKGKLEFNMGMKIKLYFERRQYVLFKIFKKKTNKIYTVKCPISKVLRDNDGTFSLIFDKNSLEENCKS